MLTIVSPFFSDGSARMNNTMPASAASDVLKLAVVVVGHDANLAPFATCASRSTRGWKTPFCSAVIETTGSIQIGFLTGIDRPRGHLQVPHHVQDAIDQHRDVGRR